MGRNEKNELDTAPWFGTGRQGQLLALVDVQGLSGQVDSGIYPARVSFSTKYNGAHLFCNVDVDFFADEKPAVLKEKPRCTPWTEDLIPKPENEEDGEAEPDSDE